MKRSLDRKKLTSGIILLLAGTLAVSTMVFAAGPGGGGPGGGSGNMGDVKLSKSVITVKLQNPTIGSLTRSTEFIGKIEPAESVNVYPEVSGKVSAVHFEAGDTVHKGDLLFEIDDTDAQLAYQIAQASYDEKVISADTTLGSSYDSKLNSAKSTLDSAQQSLNNARLKLKDYNDGYDDSLISAQKAEDKAEEAMNQARLAYENNTDESKKAELYAAWQKAEQDYSLAHSTVKDLEDDEDSEARDLRNSYKNAQTSYEAALKNYNLIAGGSLDDTKASTDASLKSAGLTLEKSSSELEKYKIYSPIDGVIESKSITLYETAGTNTAAYTISNKNDMSVKFNATADAAVALSTGDSITLTKRGREYTAVITSIDSKADSSSGLFPIEAQVQDDDGTLLTGISMKVSAATAKAEDAVLVPVSCVYYDDGQAYVFTYADGKAHRTDIETGMSNADYIVAVSGVTTDSQIITTWHPDLKDGAEVVLSGAEESSDQQSSSSAEPSADSSKATSKKRSQEG